MQCGLQALIETAAQGEGLDDETCDRLFDAAGILITGKSAALAFAQELAAAVWRVCICLSNFCN